MNIFTYFRIKICTQSTLILRNRSANQEYKLVVFNLWKIKEFCALALKRWCFLFLYRDGCHFAGLYKIASVIQTF